MGRPGMSSAVYEAYYKTLGDFHRALETQLKADVTPSQASGAVSAVAPAPAASSVPAASASASTTRSAAPTPATSPLKAGTEAVAESAATNVVAGSDIAECALCELVEQLSSENQRQQQEIATLREDLMLTKDCIARSPLVSACGIPLPKLMFVPCGIVQKNRKAFQSAISFSKAL